MEPITKVVGFLFSSYPKGVFEKIFHGLFLKNFFMKKYATFSTLLICILFSKFSGAQTYLWDQTHSCKWRCDKPNTKNVYFTYKGTCKDGYISGYSEVLVYDDGEKWAEWKGKFDRGIMNGKGSMEFFGAFKYEGEFKDNKRDGKGKLFCNNCDDGEIAEAQFKDDEIDGQVLITYKNGDKLKGYPQKGNWLFITGKGIYYFANGDRYEGDFAMNDSKGGIIYHKNGTKETGNLKGHLFTSSPSGKSNDIKKQKLMEWIGSKIVKNPRLANSDDHCIPGDADDITFSNFKYSDAVVSFVMKSIKNGKVTLKWELDIHLDKIMKVDGSGSSIDISGQGLISGSKFDLVSKTKTTVNESYLTLDDGECGPFDIILTAGSELLKAISELIEYNKKGL